MNVERLFDFFKAVNLFGTPILFPFVAVVVMVGVMIVAVGIGLRYYEGEGIVGVIWQYHTMRVEGTVLLERPLFILQISVL